METLPPEIEALTPRDLDFLPGAVIEVRGRSLDAKPMAVQIGPSEVEPISSGPVELTFRLPASCRAGVHPVRVLLGPKDGVRFDSNQLPLTIRPNVAGKPLTSQRDIGGGQSVPIAQVHVSPVVEPGQRVEVLLNPVPAASSNAKSHRCRAEAKETPHNLVEVQIAGVKKGKYLLRVKVDGVASALTQDADGLYDGPALEVK